VLCEPSDVGAVGVHHIDFIVSVTTGIERYFCAIGGPSWVEVAGASGGEALEVHRWKEGEQIDFRVAIAVGDKSYLRAIRRPAWSPVVKISGLALGKAAKRYQGGSDEHNE
jgi:hypothetical protein